MTTFIPLLRYQDCTTALRWLADAFGFEETLVVKDDDGSVGHAQMRFGDGFIMLASATLESEFGKLAARGVGTQMIYAVVKDPDAHHSRALAAGAEIVMGLRDQDYGSREYACRDPEGNLWCFGTYHP